VDATRATAVALVCGGDAAEIEAEREVILCAGAIHSPHLLMHSGIATQTN